MMPPLSLPITAIPRVLPWLALIAVVASGLSAQTPKAEPPPASTKVPAPAAKAPPPIIFVPTPYDLEDVFPEFTFEQPLGIVTASGDNKRLFIVEKTGRIQVITGLEKGAKPTKKLFLDLTQLPEATLETAGECGVLGVAFPPDHTESGRLYVYYSLKIDGQLHQRVSRFNAVPGDPDRVDNMTEQPLISQLDEAGNHNGGDLQFDPDGFLYISVGDGGAGNDKFDNARFINKGFHGAILRIDADKKKNSLPPNPHPSVIRGPDNAAFYAVPQDNPFVGMKSHHGTPIDPTTVRTEIWATGLRNPWRMSLDPVTKRLFTGDVGQGLYEEVDIILKGGDYGWSHREGLHPFPQGPGLDKEPPAFEPIAPIFEYPRTVGLSITGGIVYHGSRNPKLKGAYIFADYATGRVIALRDEGRPVWTDQTLAQEPGIAGIGRDPRNGDVLFANMALGKIKRLKFKTASASE